MYVYHWLLKCPIPIVVSSSMVELVEVSAVRLRNWCYYVVLTAGGSYSGILQYSCTCMRDVLPGR